MDVLTCGYIDLRVRWFSNDGQQSFSARVVDDDCSYCESLDVIDLDGDADLDVTSAANLGGEIAWYENDGSSFVQKRVIGTGSTPMTVDAIDVDGDGDADAVGSFFGTGPLSWYENDGSQSFGVRDVVEETTSVRSVFAIDADGDGDVDVCLLYTSPSPRDQRGSRMPSSA